MPQRGFGYWRMSARTRHESVRVTPEMVGAGYAVLTSYDSDGGFGPDVVAAIFSEMLLASPQHRAGVDPAERKSLGLP